MVSSIPVSWWTLWATIPSSYWLKTWLRILSRLAHFTIAITYVNVKGCFCLAIAVVDSCVTCTYISLRYVNLAWVGSSTLTVSSVVNGISSWEWVIWILNYRNATSKKNLVSSKEFFANPANLAAINNNVPFLAWNVFLRLDLTMLEILGRSKLAVRTTFRNIVVNSIIAIAGNLSYSFAKTFSTNLLALCCSCK